MLFSEAAGTLYDDYLSSLAEEEAITKTFIAVSRSGELNQETALKLSMKMVEAHGKSMRLLKELQEYRLN